MFKPYRDLEHVRRYLAVGFVVAFLVWAVLGAMAAHPTTKLDADLRVVDYEYNATSGDVNEVTLRVEYRGDRPVDPVFNSWDQNRKGRYFWIITDGPDPLPPKTTATYVIVPPFTAAEINSGAPGLIRLRDSGEPRLVDVTFKPDPREGSL